MRFSTFTVRALLASLPLSTAAMRASPELRGILGRAHETWFGIASGPEKPTRWVQIGDTFDGYLVEEYRDPQDVLILKKSDEQIRLKLKTSRVQGSRTIERNLPRRPDLPPEVEAKLRAQVFSADLAATTARIAAVSAALNRESSEARIRQLSSEREALIAREKELREILKKSPP